MLTPKSLLLLPRFFWFKVFKYYLRKAFGRPTTALESNWIYFLSLAASNKIVIREMLNEYVITNKKFNHKVHIRKGDSSDILVYLQIFFLREYEPLINCIKGREVRTIIDVGSNVGFFTLYTNYFYRTAKIISIEPDKSNCEQIAKNSAANALDDHEIEQKAIWFRNAKLDLVLRADNLEWNYGVTESITGTIEAITFNELLDKHNIDKVDILKIDIEGTEETLFLDPSFLALVEDRVYSLAIETHSHDGKSAILNRLRLMNFSIQEVDNILFAYKK